MPAQANSEGVLAAFAARDAFGRLTAYLAARTRDIAGAEDLVADALAAALADWPRNGVPHNPQGWLLAVAERRFIDRGRRQAVARKAADGLRPLLTEAAVMDSPLPDAERDIPDERLKLLFVCAHPAIDPAARAPLMLQTVMGLDAGRIAAAFLSAPAAMSQRLVRAKAKIKESGVRFEIPDRSGMPERVAAVLDAIYVAYTAGWDSISAEGGGNDLTSETIWLGRLLAQLLPEEPEVHGLLALMLHCEARHGARRDARTGAYIPLDQQETALWLAPLIAEADATLVKASRFRQIGRFQLEAAIQAVHNARARTGKTDWNEIALLYEGLCISSPSIGARVGRALALSHAQGIVSGLTALDALSSDAETYQPYWAARAELLARSGRTGEAEAAFTKAIALTADTAVRDYLKARRPGAMKNGA